MAKPTSTSPSSLAEIERPKPSSLLFIDSAAFELLAVEIRPADRLIEAV